MAAPTAVDFGGGEGAGFNFGWTGTGADVAIAVAVTAGEVVLGGTELTSGVGLLPSENEAALLAATLPLRDLSKDAFRWSPCAIFGKPHLQSPKRAAVIST